MNSYEAFKKIFTDQGITQGKEQERQKNINTFASFLRKINCSLSEEKAIDLATKIILNNWNDGDDEDAKDIISALRSKAH